MRISINRRNRRISKRIILNEAHLYERGEMHTKDGWEVLSRRISIFILVIQFYKYVGSNLDSHT